MVTRLVIALLLLAVTAHAQVVRKVLRPDLGAPINQTGVRYWWPLAEGGIDRSSTNHGQVGSAAVMSSPVGTAMRFTGSTLVSNFPSIIFPVEERTIEFWFSSTNRNVRTGPATTRSGSSGLAIIQNISGSNTLTFAHIGGANVTISNLVHDGRWQHIAYTKASSTAVSLYVNGVAVASVGSTTETVGSFNGSLGEEERNDTPRFDGGLAQFRVHNRAASAGEIRSRYYARRPTQ